jgi:hypothetical protein
MKNGERRGARKSVEIVMSQASEYQGTGLNSQGSHTQGEIVNILLKIKNSFLPTKQILIGL